MTFLEIAGLTNFTAMDVGTMLMLAIAAFVAGALNAVAGGGTFFTLPALIFAGLPPVMANATSAAVVSPGYISAAMGFREALASVDRRDMFLLLLLACAGAVLGSFLLLGTSDSLFRALAPYLLLLATVLFYFGPRMSARHTAGHSSSLLERTGLLLVSGYGGYFNGGLGIALLSVFSISGRTDLNLMNGLKCVVSATLSAVSVAVFAFAGLIHWSGALAMMILATAGGYVGAHFVQRVDPERVRIFVLTTGVFMTLVLFIF